MFVHETRYELRASGLGHLDWRRSDLPSKELEGDFMIL
jgi:hypothetical protein